MKKRLFIFLLITTILLVGCEQKEKKDELGKISINEINSSVSEDTVSCILEEKYLEEGELDIYIYYENRDLIIAPDFMPTKANTMIAAETQSFLESMGYNDVQFLYVIDSSVQKKSSISSFESIINGIGDILMVEYNAVTNKFSFKVKMQAQ